MPGIVQVPNAKVEISGRMTGALDRRWPGLGQALEDGVLGGALASTRPNERRDGRPIAPRGVGLSSPAAGRGVLPPDPYPRRARRALHRHGQLEAGLDSASNMSRSSSRRTTRVSTITSSTSTRAPGDGVLGRDLLERDFGDEWVEELEEIERLIAGASSPPTTATRRRR